MAIPAWRGSRPILTRQVTNDRCCTATICDSARGHPKLTQQYDLTQLLTLAQERADLLTVAVAISYDEFGWLIVAGFKL